MEGLALLRISQLIHLLFPYKLTPILVNIRANLIYILYNPGVNA